MVTTVWFGVMLGLAIGCLYGGAVFGVVHLANRYQDNRFLIFVFGGMLLRMVVVLLVVSAVLLFVPVHIVAFALALAGAILLGLGLEVWMLHRRLHSKTGSS
ncbi:MAG: hypothetical protein SH809_08050 [Rhodothermales bacterium]|nr:hypothetical protein [Rhodothermales bacterium]